MTRPFLTLCAAAAASLALAGVQPAHAQVPLGVQVNVGPASFSYQQGYAVPVAPAYGRSYYPPAYAPGCHPPHHHAYYGRPAVILPPAPPCGPGHGAVLVPHRGHYDAYRY